MHNKIIKSQKFQGIIKINTDTILYYSGLIPSDKIDKNQVNKAIKNLYCLGYFLEIYITVTSKKVKIRVNKNSYLTKFISMETKE